MLIVQRKVYDPGTETVTLLLFEVEFSKTAVPGPDTKVQIPLEGAALFPERVYVNPQKVASFPALGTTWLLSKVMLTWSVVMGQTPLKMVH